MKTLLPILTLFDNRNTMMWELMNTEKKDALKTLEYEQVSKMIESLEKQVGTIDDNLARLKNLYDRAILNKSAQALDVEFKIIQYINELHGIKPEKKWSSINIAVFNYDPSNNFKH